MRKKEANLKAKAKEMDSLEEALEINLEISIK